MRKVCVVVASRANYARIKTAMMAIREHPDLELQVIATASAVLYRFGEVVSIMRADGFEPVATPYIVLEGDNPSAMAKSTGLGILELTSAFDHLKPDIVLTVADRYETMATAIAATYKNIALAHTQGGESTGSIDESVRHAITKLAHIHFPATERARRVLLRMGEDPSKVFLTGCPAMDILEDLEDGIPASILENLRGVGKPIDFSLPYVVVLQHPVTTEYPAGEDQISETLQAIQELGMQAVWLWPNVDAGTDHISKQLRSFRESHANSQIRFTRNLPPEDYARLLRNASCLVGNSSSGIREGAYLGVPVVNIGSRQQFRERGPNVIDVDYDAQAILSAIRMQLRNGHYAPSKMFGDGSAGRQIAEHLAHVDVSIQKRLFGME